MSESALCVLVLAPTGGDDLVGCLDHLLPQVPAGTAVRIVPGHGVAVPADLVAFYEAAWPCLQICPAAPAPDPASHLAHALDQACGEWVWLLDETDRALPGGIDHLLALIRADATLDLVYGLRQLPDAQRSPGAGLQPHGYVGGRNEWWALLCHDHIAPAAALWRRDRRPRSLAAVGGDAWPVVTWQLLLHLAWQAKSAYAPQPIVAAAAPATPADAWGASRLAVWRHWLVAHEAGPVLEPEQWGALQQTLVTGLQGRGLQGAQLLQPYVNALGEIQRSALARQAGASPAPAAPEPKLPPAWWPRLWSHLYPKHAGRLLVTGTRSWPAHQTLTKAAWQVQYEPDGQPVEGLISLGWPEASAPAALGEGGGFLVMVPWPEDSEACRDRLEALFGATVHLLDPEADCPWLIAFGRKGERLQAPRRRVLKVLHSNAMRMLGGGEILVIETLNRLREHGLHADVSLSLRLDPERYDLLHVYSLYHADKRSRIEASGRPVVITPLHWDQSEIMGATALQGAIFKEDDPGRIDELLQAWRSDRLPAVYRPLLDRVVPPTVTAMLREVARTGHCLIVSGANEARNIEETLGQLPGRCVTLPNPLPGWALAEADPALFRERFGLQDFVLTVGRVEPNKNQLLTIWALRQTGLPLVVVGRALQDDYLAMCRKWAGPNVHFLGELPGNLLASAFAAARVHVLPSWHELPGLVSLEAAAAGAAVVVDNRGTAAEALGEHAHVCDPGDPDSIRTAILAAWDDQSQERREARRRHVRQHFTGAAHAARLVGIYEQTLQAMPVWFLQPDWQDPASWQPLLTYYVRAYRAADRALLRLGTAGAHVRAVQEQVLAFLKTIGGDHPQAPEVALREDWPDDAFTKVLLAGPQAERLAARYGDRGLTVADWQALRPAAAELPAAAPADPMPRRQPPAGSLPASPVALAIDGPVQTYSSLALINRTLALGLSRRRGFSVACLETNGGKGWPQEIVALVRPMARPDVTLSNVYPWRTERQPGRHWVVLQPWEFPVLARTMIGPLRDQADEVWAPTGFVKAAMVASGVPEDKVAVVPLGVATDVFTDQGPRWEVPEARGFVFLFVGGTIPRKGVDLLIEAYRRAFRATDDVTLVIKDFGTESFYRGQSMLPTLLKAQGDDDPLIVVLDRNLRDADLAALYRRADCVVQPYRAEGFCLPVAEAMATGVPVIVPDQGAARDFCTPETALLVPSRFVPVPAMFAKQVETDQPLQWLELDVTDLAEAMRSVVRDHGAARRRAARAQALIRERYTWERFVAEAATRLQALARRP